MEEDKNLAGYLKAKVERLEYSIDELKRVNEEQDKQNARYNREINKKLDEAINQLAMYRYFIIFIRAVLVGVIMVATLKFGDIVSWVKEVLNATKG